jgi:transposase
MTREEQYKFYIEVLKLEYLSGISARQLSEKYNFSLHSLSNFLKQDGIVRNKKQANLLSGKLRRGKPAWNKGSWKSKVSEEELIAYYMEGHTLKECHDKFHVDMTALRDFINSKGLLRNKSVARKESLKKHPELPMQIGAKIKGRFVGENHPNFGKPGFWKGKKLPNGVTEKAKKTRIEKYGAYFSEETIKAMSDAMKGKYVAEEHPRYGHTPPTKHSIYNGERMDSSYELAFAQYLDEYNIPWIRNKERIYLEDSIGKFTYVPDFIVNGKFIEIKGWFSPHALRVMNATLKKNMEVRIFDLLELSKLGIVVKGRVVKTALEARQFYPYFGFGEK